MLAIALALAAVLVAFGHQLWAGVLKLGVFLVGILRSFWVKVEHPDYPPVSPKRP